jgi:SAM-dependent methyltransferase
MAYSRVRTLIVLLSLVLTSSAAAAQTTQEKPFEPQVGQAGKDVVWVPTPQSLVEKMLDMAKVTSQDIVMDLGSGDGRNIIAAAKRGARATGVEYNPDMVELSRRIAAKEGVAERATFIQGDMFEADFSKATVLALFLLPDNMLKLRDKFLNLRPGTRIVANTFGIEGWEPDETGNVTTDCTSWCNALLWYVPAKVEGTWKLAQGELALQQTYQMVTGTITAEGKAVPIENGRLRGDAITFSANGVEYAGKVNGNRIEGTSKGGGRSGSWTATKG